MLNRYFKIFDAEIGTLTTFYSRENSHRGNAIIKKKEKHLYNNKVIYFDNIKIEGTYNDVAEFSLIDTVIYKKGYLFRKIVFEALEDSLIRDIVARYVIDSNLIKNIKMNNENIYHKNKNKYYQKEINEASIYLKNQKKILMFSNKKIPKNYENKFRKIIYFRDEPPYDFDNPVWILHSRILSNMNGDIFCLKGCTRMFNKPFPAKIQTIFDLFKINKIFLDVREKINQKIPFQSHSAVYVKKGTVIIIEDKFKVL